MKAIVSILLVCIATTQAVQVGQFNNILQQAQTLLQGGASQIVNQITGLLNLPSNIAITELLNGFVNQALTQVHAQFIQLVSSLINGTEKSATALRVQALQNISAILSQLANQIIEALKPFAALLKPKGLDLSSLVTAALQLIQPQLDNLVNNLLSQVLGSLGKRDITDFIINSLGLGNVWTIIQGLGQNVVGQITAIGTQLLFAGQQVWAQVRPILATLASDLFNHVGNAGDIVAQSIAAITAILAQSGKRGLFDGLLGSTGLASVWSEISNLGGSVVLQFYQVFTQLLTAGQAIYAQVIQILKQLGQDLLAHTGNAGDMVNQALAAINAVLGNQGRF